jgi:hypothetical protein
MRLLPLMLLVVCCSASAEWFPIAWADEGALWEYDPARVKRNGENISLWVKQSGYKIKQVGGEMYKERPDLFSAREAEQYDRRFAYSLNQIEIKCRAGEFRILNRSNYDSGGAPFGDVMSTPSDFSSIYPGSLIDVTATKLCNPKKK